MSPRETWEAVSLHTKKMVGIAFGVLMTCNCYFLGNLAYKVNTTYDAMIQEQTKSERLGRDMAEVREAVKGVQDLRITVEVLKYAVKEIKDRLPGRKERTSQ